jgi:hypothetical protein
VRYSAAVEPSRLRRSREGTWIPNVYELGAGIFFIGYCLFEVPSNLILHKVGARGLANRLACLPVQSTCLKDWLVVNKQIFHFAALVTYG